MTPETKVHLWMMAVGYPVLALFRLGICIYGLIHTRFRTTFWLWSVAAFLSLLVSIFTIFQQGILPAVASFTWLRYLWSVAATADYISIALNLIGLVLLIRAAAIKPNDTVA
jgi:hypothetical protein